MNNEQMTYIPDLDEWRCKDGKVFIKNEFRADNPTWISANDRIWSVKMDGQKFEIDWGLIRLPKTIIVELQKITKQKLKKLSASYLGRCKYAFIAISKLWKENWNDFNDVTIGNLIKIWGDLRPSYRTYFREFYRNLASLDRAGASLSVAVEMQSWKARNEILHLEDVINWHPTKGALIKSEESIIRESFYKIRCLDVKRYALGLAAWVLLETGKRPLQLLKATLGAVKEIESGGNTKYYISLAPVKGQAGFDDRWWPISKELADEINIFSETPEVKKLQLLNERLIVWDAASLEKYGQISVQDLSAGIRYLFAYQLRLVSPRTGAPLHVTPTRLRHTVATRLAFNGASRDLIQEILEHDNPQSAGAYIDATLSDLYPMIEKADNRMGGFFSELNERYFNGEIIFEVKEKPIAIPQSPIEEPLIVGSCGRDGACDRHPFVSCFGGCPNFLAWRDQDHRLALKHIEGEINRWESVPGNKDKEFLVKDYKKAKLGVIEVINTIETKYGSSYDNAS